MACRYDGLVGQFSPKQIPSVGVSVGIERVFAVLEGKFRSRAEQSGAGIRETRTQVSLLSDKHCRYAWVKAWQAGVKLNTAAQISVRSACRHSGCPPVSDDSPPRHLQQLGLHVTLERGG